MLEDVKEIRIYSAPFKCPYCDRAKALCERFNLKYTEVIGNLPVGLTTYPQIFFDNDYVGGCTEFFSVIRHQKSKE